MDYIVGVISLVTLGLNYLIYRRITATYSLGSVETLELSPSHCCCEAVIEHLESNKPQDEAHDPPPPAPKQDYGAWKNESGIPWVPPVKAPEPIVKAPNRGPLARPDGFV